MKSVFLIGKRLTAIAVSGVFVVGVATCQLRTLNASHVDLAALALIVAAAVFAICGWVAPSLKGETQERARPVFRFKVSAGSESWEEF